MSGLWYKGCELQPQEPEGHRSQCTEYFPTNLLHWWFELRIILADGSSSSSFHKYWEFVNFTSAFLSNSSARTMPSSVQCNGNASSFTHTQSCTPVCAYVDFATMFLIAHLRDDVRKSDWCGSEPASVGALIIDLPYEDHPCTTAWRAQDEVETKASACPRPRCVSGDRHERFKRSFLYWRTGVTLIPMNPSDLSAHSFESSTPPSSFKQSASTVPSN